MSHTPGPWVAEFGRDGSFSIEADRQGIAGGLLVLASRNEHPLLVDQMHANARLIAAAPDLLEALEAICACISETRGTDATEAVHKAESAIKKARSES